MIRSTRRFLVLAALVAAMAAATLGQSPDLLQSVCDVSETLAVYSATIRMTQHHGNDDSVIEFEFDFVPPDRMRIVYTAPPTVEGQNMILNGEQFYTYIPSLRRHVWQAVGEGASNPGEDMGFLFDFVTHAVPEALEGAESHLAEACETFVLEKTNVALEVGVLTLLADSVQQIVRLNVVDAAPVAIDIFHEDELAMEILVLDYLLNGVFDEAWFAIPVQ